MCSININFQLFIPPCFPPQHPVVLLRIEPTYPQQMWGSGTLVTLLPPTLQFSSERAGFWSHRYRFHPRPPQFQALWTQTNQLTFQRHCFSTFKQKCYVHHRFIVLWRLNERKPCFGKHDPLQTNCSFLKLITKNALGLLCLHSLSYNIRGRNKQNKTKYLFSGL